MSARNTIPIVVVLIVPLVAPAGPPDGPVASDQPAVQPAGYVGEVTGNAVYVRSGPSGNYYPVAKLNAGARVRIVGREGDWLAIVPPQGCFSLIAEMYVDTGDGKLGVVNGDNVRVRAGSMLNDKIYAIQRKLSRGAEVQIVGQTDTGYYRIAPPDGVKLWMSQQYIERIPEELLALEAASTAAPPGVEPAATEATPPGPDQPAAELTASVTETSPEQIKEYRRRIKELDAELKAELDKPLTRRDLGRFGDAFQPLADQTADEFTRVYARSRIDQIADMTEMIQAVKEMRRLREQVTTTRTDALTRRAGIRHKPLAITEGFSAKGELRPSAAYDSPTGPRRYRLVDPDQSPIRTIGYVEIPPGSDIRAEDFFGRLVGIRAREVRIETGNVDPISVFVADQIVPLDVAGE